MVARLLAFVLLVSSGCARPVDGPPPLSSPSPLAGEAAPNFKRPTLAGTMVDTKELLGRVRVVKFFAEYCEPCKRTLPKAQTLHERYDEVAFVGVSEDERADSARALVGTYGLTFPVVMDRDNVLAGRFRVRDLPITFVIDKTGAVAWVGGPEHHEDALERALRAILGS